jgi:hypothetical protein
MPRSKRSTKPREKRPPRLRRAPGERVLFADEARRPWVSLLFLSPFLAFYTAGLVWVRPDLASAADLLLRRGLEFLGVSGATAPPLVILVVFLVWHLAARDPWRFRPAILAGMALETALWVVPLIAMDGLLRATGAIRAAAMAIGGAGAGGPAWLTAAMTSIGTGIYEELLFRLVLVGGLLLLCRRVLRLKGNGAIVAGVLIAAAIFAGAHTLHAPREFEWTTFLFRTGAGVYLSYLFATRGFGIAAGVHVVYNLLEKLFGGA